MRIVALLVLAGCLPSASDTGKSGGADTGGQEGGDYDEAPSVDDDGDMADTGDTAPPEEEDDYLRLEPAATDVFVFVANPTRNTVTRIRVPELSVDTVTVGETPTAVLTSADYTRAVTLNEGSDSVTVIDAATLALADVPIRDNMNRLALSPDGLWAMAWYDPDAESSGAGGGVQSFNEVSFVRLDTLAHTPLAVGFNPHDVRWSDDGSRALVVSDAALAVVDLTAETLSPTLIQVAEDPISAPAAEEVELSPDGAWAFVRQFGATGILVVDLATLAIEEVPLGDNPTDMDLSPDGAKLAVMARGAQQLWVLDAADPFASPEVTELGAAYGSLLYAGDGQAVLYTNATRLDQLGVWDVTTGTVTHRPLVKPVQSMGVSPTGGSLLVFHTQEDAEDADPTDPFTGEWALTLVDLDDFRQNPMLLPAEPTSYGVSDDGSYGFFVMDGLPWLETLLFDSLLYEETALPSDPVHLGVLPGTDIAWANQEHDLGRISFYDAGDDALDTVTGFELNSGIERE